jgi:hypothetical protein
MISLNFKDSISTESGKEFTTVAAFDNYFSFSGRQYRVIQPHKINPDKGYSVEQVIVKQSIALIILKVISFATVIIPIIMAVGKLISRSKNQFYIESSNQALKNGQDPFPNANPSVIDHTNTKVSPKTAPKVKDKESPKVLPCTEETKQKIAKKISTFKANAFKTLNTAEAKSPSNDFSLTNEQKKDVMTGFGPRNHNLKTIPGVKVVKGGLHSVIFLDSVPGFVFKPMRNEIAAEEYITIVNKARKVVTNNNLFLIDVPESQLLNIDGNYFVMQRKADLFGSSYKEQKGVYSVCWIDPAMEQYMKMLFEQLTTFICKTDFSDVKYDNIPLTSDGKVALIDLDDRWAFAGLTRGGAGKNDGLFNYIPTEHLDHFLQFVNKDEQNKVLYEMLSKKIPGMRDRLERKKQTAENYSEFSTKNSITDPTQQLISKLPKKLFNDSKKTEFAEFIIQNMNEELIQSKNLTIKGGRTVVLKINNCDKTFKKAQEIFQGLPYMSFADKTTNKTPPSFKTLLPEILEKLKSEGYIFKYKINFSGMYIKVTC